MKLFKSIFFIISICLLFLSCTKDIYKSHQIVWEQVLGPSPKSVLLAYIKQEPIFSNIFPDTTIKLGADYSDYIHYGHYRWVKIPVQVIEYKYNKAELDERKNFNVSSTDSINNTNKHAFSFKSFKYVIYPYCNNSFEKKILKLYRKKQLIYIINPTLLSDKKTFDYYGGLTSTILEENLKYSSQLYPFPWKVEY